MILFSILFSNLFAIHKKFSLSIDSVIHHARLRQIDVPVVLKKITIKISALEAFDNDGGFLLKWPLSDLLRALNDNNKDVSSLGISSLNNTPESIKRLKKLLLKLNTVIFSRSTNTASLASQIQSNESYLVNSLENSIKYFGDDKLRMFLGPKIHDRAGHLLAENERWTNTVDGLYISRDALLDAFVLCTKRGMSQLELVIVGTVRVDPKDIEKKIWSTIGSKEDFERDILKHLGQQGQDEKHSALMGGIGLSAGYHYHTKNFIFNLRTGVDHIWGKFRQTGPQNADTENMPKLGWGITLGTGVDYKFTEKSTIGLEGGVRFSEFKIPQKDKPAETKSSWFMAPYAQIVCGFYPTPNYSISVFTGYFFPRTFSVKTEGTRITEGTQCKVDGIFGGLRFARYF